MRSLLTGVILALLGVAYASGAPRADLATEPSPPRGSLDEMLEGLSAACDAYAGQDRRACLQDAR